MKKIGVLLTLLVVSTTVQRAVLNVCSGTGGNATKGIYHATFDIEKGRLSEATLTGGMMTPYKIHIVAHAGGADLTSLRRADREMCVSHVIKRVSTPEVIVQYLIGRIREGEFGPRDQLPSERELQIRLGVGRLSLREGLARLSALGIVRIEHGKDAYIQKTINRDAPVSARGLIEGELAARTARCRTDKDIERRQPILDRPGPAMTDDEALADLDYNFHPDAIQGVPDFL